MLRTALLFLALAALIADGPLAAGAYRYAFEASVLPSGMYVVRAEAGDVVLTDRIAMVR